MDQIPFEERLAAAMRSHGSEEHATPSGALLNLLSALAREGDLAAVSRAVASYGEAYPTSKRFVAGKIPGIICNQYLIVRRGVPAHLLKDWCDRNPEWSSRVRDSLPEPQSFAATVVRIAEAIMVADTT